jgi:predicted DNA binding protein
MVSGLGTRDHWTFELRCEHRGELSRFQAYCDEHDIRAELTVLHDLGETGTNSPYGLTTAQQRALVRAHQRGYWRSPRETSLDELAEEFGITGQALGGRLQRGIDQLVGTALGSSTS